VLSEEGKTLKPVTTALETWGEQYPAPRSAARIAAWVRQVRIAKKARLDRGGRWMSLPENLTQYL
jgi:hypothetical protein